MVLKFNLSFVYKVFFELIINYDLILSCKQNEFSLTGYGSEDEFQIEVRGLGQIYWIYAPEFDDIGYFNDKHKALEVPDPKVTGKPKSKAKAQFKESASETVLWVMLLQQLVETT